MGLHGDDHNWGSAMRGLHWLVALAVLGLLLVGWLMVDMPNSPDKIKVYKLHKSIGLSVLALMVVRIGWRAYARRRPTPVPMPGWQRALAASIQGLLYLCLLLMPLSGWLFNSAAGFPLKWFELFKVPALTGSDAGLKALANGVHEYTAVLLAMLVGLHVAGALKHHWIDRDNVLRAMLPFARVAPQPPAPPAEPEPMPQAPKQETTP